MFDTVGGAAGTMALLLLPLLDAHTAISELVPVLKDDVDRLLDTAFAHHAADREADQRMGGLRKMPV